jgi:hypothetical protein
MSENVSSARIGQETIEDIILRHGQRGMKVLREYLPADYCKQAAKKLLGLPKGEILLTTGFYVAGYAETDGPVGTFALASALRDLGYQPIIVTDKFCKDFFEAENLPVEYMDINADRAAYMQILMKHAPSAVISIERCGRNIEGKYANMRGVAIDENTAKIDILTELARERNILTIGVGDGGNEIGMGNVRDVIVEKLSLVPCAVEVENLVIASVSNWGAYGLTAYLQKLSGKAVLKDFAVYRDFIARTVKIGSVDGISHELVCTVDGFDMTVEEEMISALSEAARIQ